MKNPNLSFDPLNKGDIVDLVLPASSCTKQEYEASIDFINSLGLKARVPKYDELVNEAEIFCSNTAKYRFNHLYEAIKAKDSKAIWCIKGGYGSAKLLSFFAKADINKIRKLFIGFSDITMLLNYFIAKKTDLVCIHGPMTGQIARSEVSAGAIDKIKNIIFGQIEKIEIDRLFALNLSLIHI